MTSMSIVSAHQAGHSDFQIERFIVTRGNWTPFGRWQQCGREIATRERALEDLALDRAALIADWEDAKHCAWPWPFARRVANCRTIRRARLLLSLARIDDQIGVVQRELRCLRRIAAELEETLGEIDDDRRRALEHELWNVRARARAASDLMTCGNLSESTLELLLALPVKMRSELLTEIHTTQFAMRQGLNAPLLDWIETQDVPAAGEAFQPERVECVQLSEE